MVARWFDSIGSSNANVGRLKHTHMSYKITYTGIDANEIDWEVEFKAKKKVNQVDQVKIPQDQLDVIKKALRFYIETSRRLNSEPTDNEAYDLFDAKQLCGMMDYPIHITITKEEQIAFSGKYGIDFPEY